MPLTRRAFTLGALSTAAAATGGLSLPRAALAAPNAGYVMAYFTETPQFLGADYGLHLAVSRDGLNWTPLNQNTRSSPRRPVNWACGIRRCSANRTARSW